MKQRAKQLRLSKSTVSSSTLSASTKRTAEGSPPSNPSKKTKGAGRSSSSMSLPTTPDQPTHPSDPNWSGGTEESKDEENTKAMLHEVLTDTMNFLESDFTRIHWQRSGHRVELFHSYLHSELHYSCLENETR
jgi:hypothetical protein